MTTSSLAPSVKSRSFQFLAYATISALGLSLLAHPALAQEGATPPHWIWYPTRKPIDQTPAETRYFRKAFAVKEVSRLVIDATADDRFVLYLDGREVARGTDWHTAKAVEAKLAIGPHVLAAVATNEAPGPAGFLLRGSVLPLGQGVPIHTDRSWRTTDKVPLGAGWTQVGFDDSSWARAGDLGPFETGPWQGVAFDSGEASGRFKVPPGFKVTMVAAPQVTGSVVSFNFDPQGRPCVGIEQAPIARLVDNDRDGQYEEKIIIAPTMRNCQGFSFIRGALFAVGDGPQGTGLYRLTDTDNDGVFETTELVRATNGGMGEHGPHSVQLGADGRLYYNNGNHAHLQDPIDPHSPVNIAYEGELLPHYNDARGHAAGIFAPGGEIYRSDDWGKTWVRIVAGFRNEYDFAFNRAGELFSFDSDMEWDVGLPWYRPVRVHHCVLGGEFGWRNGSAKWPPYYFDSLPGTFDLGRGSPTGVTFYQGHQFPKEYDDNFLICDWSQGRILAVALTRQGATYAAKASVLVSGQPLNCTDIEVGPDGAVYFTTGGRATQGGLFRVAWTQAKPNSKPTDPVAEALGIGSPLSSFSQERVDQIHRQLGDPLGTKLAEVMVNTKEKAATRVRALDLVFQNFVPGLGLDVALMGLAQDQDALVRARAVALLGLRPAQFAVPALATALTDSDPFVRRHACEGLMQQPAEQIPVDRLIPLLADPDRWIRFAARIAIEHAGPEQCRHQLLAAKAPRPLLEGMLALVRATKLDATAQTDLLARQVALLQAKLDPADRLDLLRLIGLTYQLGPHKPAESPASAEIAQALLEALPGPEGPIRLETARLLAYVAGAYSPKAVTGLLALQRDEPDHANQIHYTYCLRVLKDGWTPGEKRQLWAWYESASHWDGGYSFLGYLDFMLQNLVGILTPDEKRAYLGQGEKYPFPTRVLVRSIDLNNASQQIGLLAGLYNRIDKTDNPAIANELRALILSTIGQSRRPAVHGVLRSLYQADPARRDLIARALADQPTIEDLPILAAALDTRDPNTAGMVIAALRKIDAAPEGPGGMRNLIRLARRTGPPMQGALSELGKKWFSDLTVPAVDFDKTLSFWERVYSERFPNGPALAESALEGQNAYTFEQLVREVLHSGLVKTASPERGKAVLAKARCLDCHKFGDQGQGLGPDLTTVSSRFRPFETLESIVEPSKVISDQYKSIAIATTDGKIFNGMPTASEPNTLVLLLSDGTKVAIAKPEIEEQKESKVSVMPEGLLNGLTFQEIADMIALFESVPRVEVPADAGKKQDGTSSKARR